MSESLYYFYPKAKQFPRTGNNCERRDDAASEWTIETIFSTDPELALIAICAASAGHLRLEAKIAIWSFLMEVADHYVGEKARDPRLRSQGAWDVFSDFLFDIMDL